MDSPITYARQSINSDDIAEVVKILGSDIITRGKKTEEFEESLAGYCGARYAVVFNSGTSALHGAYFAAGLGKGDEFITSPMTFAATANAGLFLGARPVFADVQYDTGNVDFPRVDEAITDKTRLIVPVLFAGHPVESERFFSLATERGLVVVEDACHALGASYELRHSNGGGVGGKLDGRPGGEFKVGACSHCHMAVFSFHPVKAITTGEGGAVLTNDDGYYNKLRAFRQHGIVRYSDNNHAEWYYEMQMLGYNYIMTDFQAALGISQLKRLDGFIARRREIVKRYNEAFEDNPYFDVPVSRPYVSSAWHLYPIRLKDACLQRKSEIFSGLRKQGVGVQVHYIPVYRHPYYESLGYKAGLCPVSEDFYRREISLPIYPAMSDGCMERVIEGVTHVFEK